MHFTITGGTKLRGSVSVNGAKNSALAIISAAALAQDGATYLENVPLYTDILDLCEILRALGAEVTFVDRRVLKIEAKNITNCVAPYEKARKLRGSTYIVGLLLARMGKAEVAMPGGCDIGARPIDCHLKGFEALGARAWLEHGSILAEAPGGLRGTDLFIDRASFGATINLMIAASLGHGTTHLENAAREPEIVDLANFLTGLGATVRGAGTSTIRIEGSRRLHGVRHEIIPDRLEAGTYLLAGLASGGEVEVKGVIPEHLATVCAKLVEVGADLEMGPDSIRLKSPQTLAAVDVQTQPHPGFPTDLHPPIVAALARANGISLVQETVFENRFNYVNELVRMGASVRVDRDTAIVRGQPRLSGAPVEAPDIRGGAALVIAALAAEGQTTVSGVQYVERGYEDLEGKLCQLGAEVSRDGHALASEGQAS